jgi:tetratricopeptide (TPR) repeat protein
MTMSAPQSAPIAENPYESCCREAERLAGAGQIPAALQVLETFVAKHPTNAEAWNDIAVLQHSLGRAQPALVASGIAVSLDGASALYRHTRASVLLGAGELDAAALTLAPVLTADPHRVDALILAGDIRLARQQRDDARTFYEEAAKADPASAEASERLALLAA